MEAINEAIDSINNLLINSAKLANCYPHNGNKVNLKSSNKFKQPWFDKTCFKLRNKYRNARNSFFKLKTDFNKQKMILMCKKYKKI